MHKFQRVQNKARMGTLDKRLQLPLNLCARHACTNTLASLNDKQPRARGQVAGVYRVDMPQLRGSRHTVLVCGRECRAQIEVNHLVALVHPGLKKLIVLPGPDCRRFRQQPPLPPGGIQVVRHNIHAVSVLLFP